MEGPETKSTHADVALALALVCGRWWTVSSIVPVARVSSIETRRHYLWCTGLTGPLLPALLMVNVC